MLIYHNVDYHGYESQNFKLENLATLSQPPGERGRLYYDTTDEEIKWFNGTSWIGFPASYLQPGDNVSQLINDAGYLTAFSETDPIFTASPAAGITSLQITNWDTAFLWGNHALAGYLTSYSETDTLDSVTTRGATTANNLTVGGLIVSGNLTVSGTTTIINTEEIDLADNIIRLNSNATGIPSENAGLIIERGDDPNRGFRWNETLDIWEIQKSDGTYYEISVVDPTGKIFTQNVSADTTITHSMNSRDLDVTMVDTVTFERYYADWSATTLDTIDVSFYETPTNPIRVLIEKIA